MHGIVKVCVDTPGPKVALSTNPDIYHTLLSIKSTQAKALQVWICWIYDCDHFIQILEPGTVERLRLVKEETIGE